MGKLRNATLDDLLTQMKITNRLLAVGLKDTMKQSEIIKALASSGASSQEIADVLDTTPNTVNVTLHRLKRRLSASTSNLKRERSN